MKLRQKSRHLIETDSQFSKPKNIDWSSKQLGRNVFHLTIPAIANKSWEWYFLLTSDQHWDNPMSNHAMQIKHLNEVRERGGAMLSAGDVLCLMQGKYDRRANKSALRPEHRVDNYLDAVINTATDFFSPYAHNIVMLATGNHESSIAERYETNMIDRLVGAINNKTGAHVYSGGFSGWVVFQFFCRGKSLGRVNLHYDHGYGGGGPVTADMIQHQRRAVYLPDADIICSGHTHDQWVREFARVRLEKSGKIWHDIQTHIKLPSYKDEYKDGYGGWAVASKGMPPKPIGAWWLRFYYDSSLNKICYQTIRAQ